MYLLVIGSDRNLFKENSDVWNRYLDYGKLFEEIHVIVFNKRDTNIRMRANDTNNTNNTSKSARMTRIGNNVFVYPTNHVFKFLYLWNVYKISKEIIKHLSLVVGCRSLVVSSQDAFEAGLAGWMIKKLFKLPLQIQIHTDFLSPYFWRESLMNKIRVLLAKFLIPRADGLRVVSDRIKDSLTYNLQPTTNNITVLPIFVDVEAIKNIPVKVNLHNKYPQFDFIILMASRLSKEKNIGLAIEAVWDIVKGGPKNKKHLDHSNENSDISNRVLLVICGKGPELENLKFKIKNLKLRDNVAFEGWSRDLISYYKTADLFLFTSNYEGYGRSVVEAMSAALPVVMTDVGLAGEVLINGKSGLVVPVGDKKALVDALISLIEDKQKRESFIVESRKMTEKLITKGRYLELYKQSIESCTVNH